MRERKRERERERESSRLGFRHSGGFIWVEKMAMFRISDKAVRPF